MVLIVTNKVKLAIVTICSDVTFCGSIGEELIPPARELFSTAWRGVRNNITTCTIVLV